MSTGVAAWLTGLSLLAVALVGCGVDEDRSPVPIPDDRVPDLTSTPSPSAPG